MNRKRPGFSLVLSLAIMAGMVMLVIVLAAFLQVETRLALSHSGYMRARLNAVASAKIALGQLQQMAGPDQRVTMRADMYDAGKTPNAEYSTTVSTTDNPSAPTGGKLSHQKRYWTGVWATGGISSNRVRDWNVAKPHDTRLFLGWLCSPGVISSTDPEIADVTKLPNYTANSSVFTYPSNASPYPPATSISDTTGKSLINDLSNPISVTPDTALVPLLSRGSVKMTTNTPNRWALEYSGSVDALPVPLPGPNTAGGIKYGVNGRYAFWVGDEGLKAKANLPDAYAMTSGGGTFKTSLSVWDEGFRGSGAQRSALESILITDKTDYTGTPVLANTWKFSTWRDSDIANAAGWESAIMSRVKRPSDLTMWANTVGGTAAGDAMKDAAKALFHDVTPWSFSTITDNYNGGIKIDLSTAFELPYAVYRGLETYYGQKNDKTTPLIYNRAPALFHDASNRLAAPPASLPYANDIDYNQFSRLAEVGTPDQILSNYPRSPEWAPVYLSTKLGAAYTNLGNQNGGETPQRVGFVYEVPLRNGFWNGTYKRWNPFYILAQTTSALNLNARIERGPTWDLYRNYYRLYKKEIEACTAVSTLLNQPAVGSGAMYAHGIEPLSFVNSGSTAYTSPYGFLESGGSMNLYQYFNYANSKSDGTQYDFHMDNTDRKDVGNAVGTTKSYPIAWPTNMKIAPSIIRFAMMYSMVWNDDKLGLCVDPFIVVHNPYDCAIEFAGINMVYAEKYSPHVFEFYFMPNPANPTNITQIGDVFPAQTFEQSHQISFRALAGSRGTTNGGGSGATNSKVFRLEPGEVRVIGATNDPQAKPVDAYRSIDIPCDFVYTEGSQFYIPMDAYANVQYRAGGPNTGNNFPKAQPISATDKNFTDYYGTSNTALLYSAQVALPGWDGTVTSLNSKAGGGKIIVKARNEGGINFGSRTDKSSGIQYYFNFPNSTVNARGSGHVLDGGNQDFVFYLQYDTNAKGVPLAKYRHWMGPKTVLDEDKTDGTGSITNYNCVNEPLILALRVMTTGWPLFGNAAKGYASDNSDPQVGPVKGFNSDYLIGNTHPIARTLPEAFNIPDSSILPGKKYWRSMDRIFSNNLLLSKQQFFILDFFARGATETSATEAKKYCTTYPGILEVNWPNKTLAAPEEMMPAPMSPYFISTRPQQASYLNYDGKSHVPLGWICRQNPLTASITDKAIEFTTSSRNQSYWGKSISANGNPDGSNVVLFPIPRRPLLSISQLGAAGTAQFGTDPDLTVGASFANPGIKDLTKIVDWPGSKTDATSDDPEIPELGYATKLESKSGAEVTSGNPPGEITRNKMTVRTDAAFAANLALWDAYWFSGLNTQAKSYADTGADWPTGPNLPSDSAITSAQSTSLTASGVTDLTTLTGIKTALDKGYNPLANKRVSYRPDPAASTTATIGIQNVIFPDYLTFPHPTYLGRRSLYDGGFNVNSTSKAAWKAILASLRKQKLPEGSAPSDGTPLTRFARAFGAGKFNPNDTNSTPWNTYRELDDDEINALAAAVVSEVRKRGPFMSLSDFINRRLVNDDKFGLKGALQAAIDATDDTNSDPEIKKSPINGTAIKNGGGTFATVSGVALSSPYLPIAANDRFPSIRSMSKTNKSTEVTAALGAPGIVTQMDVLNSIGPNLTARSDTFVIRAYGEAYDANGQSIGKAWVEVVAQRSTDYMALANEEPNRRAQFYRNNSGTATSDYETKPTIDHYERNTQSDPTKRLLLNLNRVLGRRFNTVSLRWLNPQEI